ncbi:hypothetical protein U1Q18_016974 [Sarracenia purpurea var. burkii]
MFRMEESVIPKSTQEEVVGGQRREVDDSGKGQRLKKECSDRRSCKRRRLILKIAEGFFRGFRSWHFLFHREGEDLREARQAATEQVANLVACIPFASSSEKKTIKWYVPGKERISEAPSLFDEEEA